MIINQETVEHDTEYMQFEVPQGHQHHLDLRASMQSLSRCTALTAFIGWSVLCGHCSAFVIDVQSKLEPDSAERSEAYLRAIFLILDQSISPNEDPAAPPAQLN